MKKRIFSMLLFAALSVFFAFSVYGEEAPKINVDSKYYDEINDCFRLKGNIDNEIGNIPMTMEIYYGGERIYIAKTTAVWDDSAVVFEFEPVYLLPTSKSGDYAFYVRSAFCDTYFTDSYKYYGSDYFLPAITAINKSIENKSETELLDVIKNNEDAFIVNYSDIENLSVANRSYFASLFFGETYSVPEKILTEQDSEAVKAALLKFRDNYRKYLSMAEFFNIKSIENSVSWFENYGELYGYNAQSKIYPYLDVKSSEKFIKRISLSQVNTIEKVSEIITEYVLLTNIELKNGSVVTKIFTDFPQYFSGLSSEYDNLSISNKGAVMNYLAENHYDTYQGAVEAANMKAKTYSDSGTGGGSSASWGGSSAGYSVGNVEKETAVQAVDAVFSDLNKNHWAYDSIIGLYEKKAISGYENGTFMPDKYVTRAEFIKMLMNLYKADVNVSEEDFSDVTVDHWAYGCIKSARQAGLIMGNENNYFMPEELITREDMLVILLRAVKGAGGRADFDDVEDISPYALSAVGYFYGNGIVNGNGNNMFLPKNNATRAEVCKILMKIYG